MDQRFYGLLSTFAVAWGLAPTAGTADLCAYRPSYLLGGLGTGAVVAGGGATVATATAANVAGVYTLVHSTSGLTMVGSTLAGTSAAGTIGIIGGTGGAIGTATAIVTAPGTIIAAAVAAVGTGGIEAYCYYGVDEKILEYEAVEAILIDVAATADPEILRYYYVPQQNSALELNINGEQYVYRVEDLFFINGVLKVDDWGPNTEIASLIWLEADSDEPAE